MQAFCSSDVFEAVKDEDGDAAAVNIEIVDDAQGSLFGASGVAPSTAVYAARGTPFSSAQRAAEQGRLGVATVGGELVVVQGLVNDLEQRVSGALPR